MKVVRVGVDTCEVQGRAAATAVVGVGLCRVNLLWGPGVFDPGDAGGVCAGHRDTQYVLAIPHLNSCGMF